jgi:hypothetical protein
MKVQDSLDVRGITYVEVKENKDRFSVIFESEEEKAKAIRCLLKDDCAVTNDSGLKISGVKRKRFERSERKPSDKKKDRR